MLCVQGDLVVVYLGLHNQFQSLYLTKHAKETGKKKADQSTAGLAFIITAHTDMHNRDT